MLPKQGFIRKKSNFTLFKSQSGCHVQWRGLKKSRGTGTHRGNSKNAENNGLCIKKAQKNSDWAVFTMKKLKWADWGEGRCKETIQDLSRHASSPYEGVVAARITLFCIENSEKFEVNSEIIAQGGAHQKRDLVVTTYHASCAQGQNRTKQTGFPKVWGRAERD